MKIRKRKWTWKGEKRVAWRVDWKSAGGRRLQKQFRTRQEAELFYAKLLKERQSRLYGTLVSDCTTFAEFMPIYDQRKPWKSEITRERFSYSLNKVFLALHPCPLLDISEEMIEEIRDRRLKAVAPATVHLDLAVLSDFFAWAIRLHYLERNPMARVGKPALPVKQDNPAEFIPLGDLDALFAVAGQDACFYKFGAATGIRESELIALEWADIRDGFAVVRRGKGRKQRVVPLIPEAVDALQAVPRRIGEGRIFWWVKTRRQAHSRFKRCLRWARLDPKYTFHMLRHSYASFAAMSGVDLKVIAEAMGHTTTTITRRYAHLSPSYQRNEMLKVSRFWKSGTRKGQDAAKAAEN